MRAWGAAALVRLCLEQGGQARVAVGGTPAPPTPLAVADAQTQLAPIGRAFLLLPLPLSGA